MFDELKQKRIITLEEKVDMKDAKISQLKREIGELENTVT
jgi:hypothetical protein